MTCGVALTPSDLDDLDEWFPKLRFARDEQRAALLHPGTADFQAAPGSGKTTLLGAKLALLAKRWPHTNRGLCVLSHTNVAKDEIEERLRSSPYGEQLLSYPHFIGTIQTFANRYLAVPLLRHLGVELKEVDDEAFAERFFGWASQDPRIKPWLRVDEFARGFSLKGVRYEGADLTLTTTGEVALPNDGPCLQRLNAIKSTLAAEGWLRYDDMYAYAERAIRDVPSLAESVAYRFPLVFIDEMQDTSEAQLRVLSQLFEGKSALQRFGDVNQSILRRKRSNHPAAFPRASTLEVATSERFGVEIASVANKLRRFSGEIQGVGLQSSAPPTLCIYSDATVDKVVGRFGDLVAGLFTQQELDALPVKALCAVKKPGNLKQQVGRHLPDYFPAFDSEATRPSAARSSVCALVREAARQTSTPAEHARAVSSARNAVHRLLKACSYPAALQASSWTQLARLLSVSPEKLQSVNLAVLRLTRDKRELNSEYEWAAELRLLLRDLAGLGVVMPGGPTKDLDYEPSALHVAPAGLNRLAVSSCGRAFDVHLSTIAAAKGETHLATLVLESCFKMKYDLRQLLPFLSGERSSLAVVDDALHGPLHNLFVACTRPRRLVVLAMHAERAGEAALSRLRAKGWRVLDWTT